MKKVILLIAVGVGLFFFVDEIKAQFPNCSDHWVCMPTYCGGNAACITSNCCMQHRCCSTCGEVNPGVWTCQVWSEGGFGVCDFNCTAAPTSTPVPTATPSVLCGGYAAPGECHRNSGDNCFYSCLDNGNWDGPYLTESGDTCYDRTSGDCWGGQPTNTPVPGEPTNTPRPPTNTPAPSARQILGIIKKKGTAEPWYRSDQGACSNDVHQDSSNQMNVCNSSGGCVYWWDCTAAGSTSYHTRAASTGAGPHTYIFTPPSGYDCSQVHWEYSYATCGSGCSNVYVPPDGDGDGNPDYDVDGDGNPSGGLGCVAQLYLGPLQWDNHIHWYIDMDTGGRRWINGVVVDYYPGQRYSEISQGSCTLVGPQLNCPTCDRENWICASDGPHFDLSIDTGSHSDAVVVDPSGAGYETCDWLETTRSCADLSVIGSTPKTYDDCSADVNVPGDCDWQKGLTFWMRNYCSVTLPDYDIDAQVGTTQPVIPSVNDPNVPIPNGIMVATSADATKVAICTDPTGCAVGQDTVTKDLSTQSTTFYMTIHDIGATSNILNVSYTPTRDYPCSPASADVEGTNPDPWYQVFGGSIWANNGDVYSKIPDNSLLDPDQYLMNAATNIAGSGAAVAQDDVDGSSDSLITAINPTYNWRVENAAPADISSYTYSNFYTKMGSPTAGSSIGLTFNAGTIASCDNYRGYKRCYRSGNLNINGSTNTVNIGTEKVILLVSGNVNIRDRVRLTRGRGFLLVIAGGNITVDSGVIGNTASYPAVTTPNLEGMYLAMGNFVTNTSGTGDDQLRIRGNAAGLNSAVGVDLNRSLTNNLEGPGEVFEAAPDLLLRFPHFLSEKNVLWNEVAP